MTDVISIAAAVVGLLDGAIRLIRRQQHLRETLEKYTLEIESINAIVRAIVDEDALQTAVVARELSKLNTIAARLVKRLKELDPGDKTLVRQLTHQLLHGMRDEETLADMMADLNVAKMNLSLNVQLANVGLTRMVQDMVLANVEVINRLDRLLAAVLEVGEDHGLKIAGLLKDATPTDGDEGRMALLSKKSVASLASLPALGLETASTGEIDYPGAASLDGGVMDCIIVGNTAQNSAVQLLGPVGKDLWQYMRVRIENNTASGNAVQIAYATDFDTFKYMLSHRERIADIGTARGTRRLH